METVFWVYVGIVSYLVAYVVIGCGFTFLWKMWAQNKVGIFWNYTIDKGIRMYYPRMWDFVMHHNTLYNVMYVACWPIMLPVQLTMATKSLNRLAGGRYYY